MGWTRFVIVRSVVFALAALGALAILGLASYQATQFMNNKYDKPYIIFAIIVAALTLLACLMLSMRYSFRTHIGTLAILSVLWLALASYTTDRIGYVQCESLDGQIHPSSKGNYNAVTWCRELKAMMAFSWFVWALLMISIVSWIRLSEHEERDYGDETRSERHEDREWESTEFAERRAPGGNREFVYANPTGPRYGSTAPQYATAGPIQQGVPMQTTGLQLQPGQKVIYQQPGHDVVFHNGQITQVPAGQTLLTGQQRIA